MNNEMVENVAQGPWQLRVSKSQILSQVNRSVWRKHQQSGHFYKAFSKRSHVNLAWKPG